MRAATVAVASLALAAGIAGAMAMPHADHARDRGWTAYMPNAEPQVTPIPTPPRGSLRERELLAGVVALLRRGIIVAPPGAAPPAGAVTFLPISGGWISGDRFVVPAAASGRIPIGG